MTVYRAKLIVERVEVARPVMRSSDPAKERIYDELRIEITGESSDLVLSRIINLAQAEQADRDARGVMNPPPVAPLPAPPKRRTRAVGDMDMDEEEDED